LKRMVKKILRNRYIGKILTVLLAVMLILVCIPAGMAFAASAPAAPTISPYGGSIYTPDTVSIGVPDTVSIGNIPVGDTAYYTITGGSAGTTPTSSSIAYLTPFYVSISAGTFTVDAAVYGSVNGWSGASQATFTLTLPSSASTPSVQTEYATSVTATSAVLNGAVTLNNGYAVTDQGFLWRTSSSSLNNTLDVGTTDNNGFFTDTLSGLVANTTYYVQAYATNSHGTADSGVRSFTTGVGVQTPTPTVQTEAATTITATSSALNGYITSGGGYNVTDYGFLWGTSSSSLTNKLDVGTTNYTGAFTDTLSGLTTGTTYYFEAYAIDSYGMADGAVVMSFTAGVPTTTTPSTGTAFSDVPTSYWGYNAITSLSSKGIVAGYPDGTFLPDASITRAEFATILVKALGLSTTGTTGQFTDVTADAWYYGTVNAAASASLVSGMGDNLFAPNALITREQMAVMVAKALGTKAPVVNGTELSAFSDSSTVDSWAVSGMEEAVKAGIVSGMTADTLAPQANATRAQAAAMIYKMLAV
jgi:hypothetical protein